MGSDYHICRRARGDDIRKSKQLWSQDQVLYDPEVWSSFPELLENLMERNLVTFAYIESVHTMTPRLLGALTFIRDQYIE